MNRRIVFALTVTVCAIVVGTGPSDAQQPNERVAFEAASMKPNDGSTPGGGMRMQPGGRFNAVNQTLRNLITFAYQLQAYQLVGGPSWIGSDRFDIVAKLDGEIAPPSTPGQPDRAMLAMRTLLADRFKLVARSETRELDIYAMVLARPGEPGPSLKPAGTDCSPEGIAARRAAPQGSLPPVFCGLRGEGPGRIALGGMPLSYYATNLSNQVGRFVVDRTGLDGRWDFKLSFAPVPAPGAPADAVPAVDPNAPDLFTALREQLGIKLDAAKGPVNVFVIESVARPTPD
jgi:bla regulator protein blaR1